jgi:hypothetical protein
MKTHLIITRTASLGDLATSFDTPIDDLKDVVRRQRIAPAVRIGLAGFYGSREIRRIYALAGGGHRATVVSPTASPEQWCV